MYPRSVFMCMKFSEYFVYAIHRLIDIMDMSVFPVR